MRIQYVRDLALMALVICFYVVVGADLYAQMSITPAALAAPPRSLAMFQGEYVYDGSLFWRVTTTLVMLLFVVAVGLNWGTARRKTLLAGFVAFMVINVVSWFYVFPEYLDIVGSAYSDSVDPTLVARGAAWRSLALARWVVTAAIGVLPLMALMRRPSKATTGGSSS